MSQEESFKEHSFEQNWEENDRIIQKIEDFITILKKKINEIFEGRITKNLSIRELRYIQSQWNLRLLDIYKTEDFITFMRKSQDVLSYWLNHQKTQNFLQLLESLDEKNFFQYEPYFNEEYDISDWVIDQLFIFEKCFQEGLPVYIGPIGRNMQKFDNGFEKIETNEKDLCMKSFFSEEEDEEWEESTKYKQHNVYRDKKENRERKDRISHDFIAEEEIRLPGYYTIVPEKKSQILNQSFFDNMALSIKSFREKWSYIWWKEFFFLETYTTPGPKDWKNKKIFYINTLKCSTNDTDEWMDVLELHTPLWDFCRYIMEKMIKKDPMVIRRTTSGIEVLSIPYLKSKKNSISFCALI